MSSTLDLSKLSIEELNRLEVTKKQLLNDETFIELAEKYNLTLEKSKKTKKTIEELFLICYEKWLNADLTTDLLFGMYFEDEQVSEKMINLFLRSKNIKIGKIKKIVRQEVIDLGFDIRGVRFDLLIEGSDKIINIEIQNGTTANLALRIRYYQAMLDIHLLPKGGGDIYGELAETYIIFICTDQDPLKQGELEYIINPYAHIPTTDSYKLFNTKATWIVYNASAYKDFDETHKNFNIELKSFFAFLKNDPLDNEFTVFLQEHFIKTKINKEKGRDFMVISLRDFELKRDARTEVQIEIILNMLEKNYDYEIIQDATKVSIEEIERIRQEYC